MVTTMMAMKLLRNIIHKYRCLDVNITGICWEETFIVWDASVLSDLACHAFQLSGLNFIFMFVASQRTNSTQSQIIVKKRIV